jgi:peptide/nickel transport system substrate-binding protein
MEATYRRVVALASATVILAAFGCGREPAGDTQPSGKGPRVGGQLIIAAVADITTFNEYQSAGEETEMDIIDLLFPALMTEQPDYQLHPPSFAPRLATSWEFSSDNRTLTFHLRPDARWSDGAPITAEDVRFTFQVQKDPQVGSAGLEFKDFIKDVEVVDPQTVRFHFTRVYPYQLMDANDGHIVPAHAWGRIPFEKWRTTDFEKVLVTGGQFRVASHTPQQTLVLERDPSWWGNPRPYLDRLVFRVLPDIGSRMGQLFAGQVHLVQRVQPQDADRVATDPQLRLVAFPGRDLGMIAWNTRRAPFSDRRVRRALTLGINRKAAVDTVYHGHARLASGPVLSSMWAFNRNLPQLPYDPGLASELLARAGWQKSNDDGLLKREGKTFTFDLLYPAGNTIRQQLALLIQSDLARLGVRVRPLQAEFTSLIARTDSGDFDAVLWAWEEPTKIDLTGEWSTPTETQGSNNFMGYSNPEVDRLIAAAREEPDYTKAKPILERIQQLIVEDQPATFLYEADMLIGVSRKLRGAEMNGASIFFNVDEWTWGP